MMSMNEMFRLSKQERECVEQTFKQVRSAVQVEKTTRENMTLIYQSYFPEKSLEESKAVVSSLVTGIETFAQNLEAANERSQWIHETLQNSMKRLSDEEKYQMMTAFLATVKGVDVYFLRQTEGENEAINVDKMLEDIRKNVSAEGKESITHEELENLMKMVEEAIETSSVIIVGNQEIIELIEALKEDEKNGSSFVKNFWDEVQTRSYVALAAYITYQKGQLISIGEGVNPEVIAIGIASEMEKDKLINEASLGEITWEVARKGIKLIAAVALLSVYVYVATVLVTSIVAGMGIIVGTLMNGSILGMLSGMVVGGYMCYCGIDMYVQMCEEVGTLLSKGYDKAMDLIENGYKSIHSWMINAILPTVGQLLKQTWNVIAGNKEDVVQEDDEEWVPVKVKIEQ